MTARRLAAALVLVVVAGLVLPHAAHAWTPGTHIYLGESVLANLGLLPAAVADLIRAFPFDFLYGNIAADSSMAKKYAPVGRHCHYWHVGQEIHDLAESDALRAFGLGYLCHLSADTIAHNYFVPRQLMLTAATPGVGHSYWESRVEVHLGDAWARLARDVILLDHRHADAHMDRIIAPTIFSVRTNRRLFRGMVHVTESQSWQRSMQIARERSRWELTDEDVEGHLAFALEYMIDMLTGFVGEQVAGGVCVDPACRALDPSGESALKAAKQMRREVLREAGRRDRDRLREAAQEHFGLPTRGLVHWPRLETRLPWGTATPPAPQPTLLLGPHGGPIRSTAV
ncbi:MAG TPA: zinc dependent phospholipase C family protein [Gemmatimonadales bacterium]|nr:zinc dependent phospholipase C family protein [Gemmatimonadales bacterium]